MGVGALPLGHLPLFVLLWGLVYKYIYTCRGPKHRFPREPNGGVTMRVRIGWASWMDACGSLAPDIWNVPVGMSDHVSINKRWKTASVAQHHHNYFQRTSQKPHR